MKIVMYQVKEDGLHIHAAGDGGARLAWYEDAWVIDIGFAQQWLVHYRQWSNLSLLPINSLDAMLEVNDSLDRLTQLYQQILQEDWTTLLIHGEPVSLPASDVALQSPLIDPRKLMAPASFWTKSVWSHPISVVSFDATVANVTKAFPGIAFLIGMRQGEHQLLGCSLLNCWLMDDQWISSLGPYLLITDCWRALAEQWIIVRHNHQILAEEKINLWRLFQRMVEKNAWLSDLTYGDMVSLIFDSMSIVVQPGDQVEIQMTDLGQLQNRVDKT